MSTVRRDIEIGMLGYPKRVEAAELGREKGLASLRERLLSLPS